MVAEVEQMVADHKAGIPRFNTKEKIEQAISETLKTIPPRDRSTISKVLRKFAEKLESHPGSGARTD